MEEWRTLDRFPLYSISNTGKVKGFYGKDLSAGLDTSGYRYVVLSDAEGKRVAQKVHRLVAAAFIGDVEGQDVHHKDGDRENNHAENLEILPHSEHMRRQDFTPYRPKDKKPTLRKIEGRTISIPIFNGKGGVIKYGLVRAVIEEEISKRGLSLTAFLKEVGIKKERYYNDPASLETIAIIAYALSLPAKQIIFRLSYLETKEHRKITTGRSKPAYKKNQKKPFSHAEFKEILKEVFGREVDKEAKE